MRLLGMGALLLAALVATGAAAKEITPEQLGFDSFDKGGIKLLTRTDRIAVPTYRMVFVVRNGMRAMGDSGNVSLEMSATLAGVALDDLRDIADQALADVLAQVAATGRPIVPLEEIQASKGWSELKTTAVPFEKSPFADARLFYVVTPRDRPLINGHYDAPISDQSPMALGNWRALNQISVDTKAVIVIPTVVIDFSEMSGSGFRVYSSSANISIKPGLYVVPHLTKHHMFHAKIRIAGEGANMLLKDKVGIGQAGEFVETARYGNKAEYEAIVGSLWTNPNTPAWAIPSKVYEISAHQYVVNRDIFKQAVMDGVRAVNRSLAEAVTQNRP